MPPDKSTAPPPPG